MAIMDPLITGRVFMDRASSSVFSDASGKTSGRP
jgi:hypothetical protein